MDVPAKGQVGGIESDEATRRRLAEASRGFTCQVCTRSNEAILKEQEELAAQAGGDTKDAEKVPEELRLAYREDLPLTKVGEDPQGATVPHIQPDGEVPTAVPNPATEVAAQHMPPPLVPLQPNANVEPQARRTDTDHQIDAAIWLISAVLIILVARWLLKMAG